MSTTTTEKTSRECALIAACAADEKKATDIMVQEVRDLIGAVSYTHLDVYKRQLFALCDGKLEFTKGAKHKVHVLSLIHI